MAKKCACSQSVLSSKIRPVTPVLFILTNARAAIVWTEEKRSLKMGNLKHIELQRLKNRGKKG